MKLKFRKGVFVVVYKKEKNKVLYLVLKRKLHWKGWEFSKGGVEKKENLRKAVIREIKEETGLKAAKIIDMKIKGKYNYKKMYKDRPRIKGMSWHLFAAEVGKNKVKLDKKEHSGYKWLEFEKAEKLLTHSEQRRCLRLVNSKLSL
mgnify:CR=1 FL=1